MEVQPVVEARVDEVDEVAGRDGHLLLVDLAADLAHGGVEDGDRVRHWCCWKEGGEGLCSGRDGGSSREGGDGDGDGVSEGSGAKGGASQSAAGILAAALAGAGAAP